MKQRRTGMVGAIGVIVAVLALLGGGRGWTVARQAATPTGNAAATPAAAACGTLATNWSAAEAGGIRGELLTTADAGTAMAITPVAGRFVAAYQVRLTNVSASATPSYTPAEFTLVTCDGRGVNPINGGIAPALTGGPLPRNQPMSGWLTFNLPTGAVPTALIFRAETGGSCQAQLVFPLRLTVGSATPALSATATGTPLAERPCTGGSATAGAATSGTAGAGGQGGAPGDATGGSATGGVVSSGAGAVTGAPGCPGANATGPNAQGGNGGNGGNATGSSATGGAGGNGGSAAGSAGDQTGGPAAPGTTPTPSASCLPAPTP